MLINDYVGNMKKIVERSSQGENIMKLTVFCEECTHLKWMREAYVNPMLPKFTVRHSIYFIVLIVW